MNEFKKTVLIALMAIITSNSNVFAADFKDTVIKSINHPAMADALKPNMFVSNDILKFHIDFPRLLEYIKGLPVKMQTLVVTYWNKFQNRNSQGTLWANAFNAENTITPGVQASVDKVANQAVKNSATPAAVAATVGKSENVIISGLRSGLNFGLDVLGNHAGKVAIAVSAYIIYKKISNYLRNRTQMQTESNGNGNVKVKVSVDVDGKKNDSLLGKVVDQAKEAAGNAFSLPNMPSFLH